MPCTSIKYSETELRDILLAKEIKKIGEIKDPKEWAIAMININKMVETKEVDASVLGSKYMKALGLQKGDTISRYFLDNVMLAKKRGSDSQVIKMIENKGLDKYKEISQKEDALVKMNGGTLVHLALSHLTLNLIEDGNFTTIIRPSETDPNFRKLDDEGISNATGLTIIQVGHLREAMHLLLSKIETIQNTIDPSGKVVVLSEQFILNPTKDTGGTVDLLIKFSDNSFGTLDFKTIAPDELSTYGGNKVDWITNEIIDENWIPGIKKVGIKEQLGDYNHTLSTFYGMGDAVISRGIPIYVRYGTKARQNQKEGARLSQKITYIAMQGMDKLSKEQNAMLSHVPVQEFILLKDKHKQHKINDALRSLEIIITNAENELENLSGTEARIKLKALISKYRKAKDKLILDQDFNGLYEAFKETLSNITIDGKLTDIYNIQDPMINGEPNPHYLSITELNSKIREIEALRNLIVVSPYYIQDLQLTQDPSIYTDYLADVDKLSGEASRILEELKSIKYDRTLNAEEQRAVEDMAPVGWWSKFFRSMGDQVAVPFRKITTLFSNAQNLTRLNLQNLFNVLNAKSVNLEKAGKRLGMSLNDMFELLIHPKTENLWGEYDSVFWKDFETAQQNKDNVWLDKYLVKKKDAQLKYERNLEIWEASNSFDAVKNPEGYDKRLQIWKKNNSPDAVRYTKGWGMYYEFSKDIPDSYLSEGYKKIKDIPELLDYYNFWTESMTVFNEMLGLKYGEKLPKNFLPHIRQNIVGLMSQGTFEFSHLWEVASSLLEVRQDDTGLGDMTVEGLMNPVTGRPQHTIPRHFINPIKDSKGQIQRGMKVRDLNKSLYIFARMAYNYHFMKTTAEPHIEALRDYMMEIGMQQITESKRKKKLLGGAWAKIKGEGVETVEMFDRYVNYHLYGIKVQDAKRSHVKLVQALKSLQSNIELSFAPLLWTGNFVQVTGNAYFEGIGGYYYTAKQMTQTQAEATGVLGKEPMEKYSALNTLFEFSPGIQDVNIKNMSVRIAERYINWDTAHIGMRKTEQLVNNNMGISMLKNWAIVDNNLIRIVNAPEGTKSLYDSSRMENGVLVVDGVTDSNGKVLDINMYTKIRNLAVYVSGKVKGTMNPQDLSLVYMSLIPNAMMGFKTWMPGMLDAKFSELRYSPKSNSMVEGKYTAFFSEFAREDRAFVEWVQNIVIPKGWRLLSSIATFGAINPVINPNSSNKFTIDLKTTRAKNMFEKYKTDFRHDSDIQALSFEDFLDYHRRQIRSAAAEMATIISIITIVLMLKGDHDDDGEADWKKNMWNRTLFRMLNRARRELAFYISPSDWENLFRMPIPIMSLFPDTLDALADALSGMGDIISGRPPVKAGGRSKFYKLWRRVPGNKLILMFEPDEMSKLREV